MIRTHSCRTTDAATPAARQSERRTGRILALFTGLCLTGSAFAQAPLSVEDCIDLALKQNLSYLSNRQGLARSRSQLIQARSAFELNADADLILPSYQDTRDLIETQTALSRFREENTNMSYIGRLEVSQRFRHLGRFSVSTQGVRQDFTSNRRQDFLDISGNISFNYSHDIFTTPREELNLKQAELGLAIGRASLDRQEIVLEDRITNSYYDLVQSIRQLEIQDQRLAAARGALDLAQRKFEIGLIAEVEALNLEVEKLRAEASYARAETQIQQRRDVLRDLLGMDPDEPLEVITDVEYAKVPVDQARAVELALARRTDMMEAEIQTRAQELSLTQTKQSVGPTATLNTSVSLRGRGNDISAISSTFERNTVSARIDIGLPLLDGGDRRSRVRQAEISLSQTRLSREERQRDVVRQVRNAVRNVNEAERQIDLLRAALEVAERKFEVEQSRFELGLADSQDLLDAQTDLTVSRLEALDSVITYQRQLKSLHLATMADLSELSGDSTN